MSLRVIFAGTPEFATYPLQALIQSEHQVVAAFTQPDRPAGRGKAWKTTRAPAPPTSWRDGGDWQGSSENARAPRKHRPPLPGSGAR